MLKTNSLFTKTFLLIAGSMTVFILIFNYYSIRVKEASLIDVINSKTKTIAKSIALVSSDAMVTEDYSFIVQHNEKVITDNKDIIYLLVSKKTSNLNLVNKNSGWELIDSIPAELVKTQVGYENSIMVESSLSNNEKVYHFSYPIIFSGIEWGWVVVGYSLEQYNASLRDNYRDNLLLLLATLILSLVFSYVLTKWIVGPIILLKNAAKQVAAGNFSAKVDIKTNDEISELMHSFNIMVQTIRESDEKLRKSNEDLEKRVTLRTQELNELNISLDKKVKEEVQKRSNQEQMLIHQSRFAAMGEMIGNIAHQWRQPLNALGLLLQNIEVTYEMDMINDAYIAKTVEKGNRLTNAMSQTIDDFRNFFKPNKAVEIFHVSSSVRNTLEMLKSSLSNNSIEVIKEVDDGLCIKGFPSEFSQVLLNILNNAKDALIEQDIEEKKIFISVFEENNVVLIEIADNAGGIPSEIIESIFDPYFTTKDEGNGTGIGLYMSKTIIENNMKGKLSVTNNADGAVFRIEMKLEKCNEEHE